jgi:2,3-bisphosphoglycerate-dependent phosphoglycerate mutase
LTVLLILNFSLLITLAKLILLRHGQSQWNLENRFTGWVDIPLTDKGRTEALEAGKKIAGIPLSRAFTSVLSRAIETLDIALASKASFEGARVALLMEPALAGVKNIPIEKDEALNERKYGDLQGLNKEETAKKFGAEQVHIWRRSYDVPPPGGESLKDTAARTLPYFRSKIMPHVEKGENVIVVAHGNSLRSIVMELDKLSKEEVLQLNIATGVPIVYDIGSDGAVLNKAILG